MTDLSEFRTALGALVMDRRHKTGDPIVRDAVWFMTAGHCSACKAKLSPGTFHVDHVKPAIRRGEDHITNYQPLCRSCNTSKGEYSDIDYRSDEVLWLLGMGDESEKLRAERDAAQQRLDDMFGDLTPTTIDWVSEHPNPKFLQAIGRAGDGDCEALVEFDFDNDSRGGEIRRLLEMLVPSCQYLDQTARFQHRHPESLVTLVCQWSKDLHHVDLDGTVFLEFDLPQYKVHFSAPQSAFLAAVFPELETQDPLRRVQCRNDWCAQDALIPDIVFNGYCKRCARKIREIALGLRHSMQRDEPRDDVQTATLVRGYWAKLGQLPYLRSIWAEEDVTFLRSHLGAQPGSRTNSLSMTVEIERLIGAERSD